MDDNKNGVARILENPVFYAAGICVGLVGWCFRYLEDGHLIVVLIGGMIGLARWFQVRRAKS
jgi:hypothetical protein